MPMPSYPDTLALVASLVSAIGCLFAVRAAFEATTSARDANLSLRAFQRQMALRELATAAGSVLLEAHRVNTLVGQVILLHRSLAMASEGTQSSTLDMYVAEAESKRARVQELVEAARPYFESTDGLNKAQLAEIDGVQLQQTLALKQIQTMREDLDNEHASVEAHRVRLLEQMEKSRLASQY